MAIGKVIVSTNYTTIRDKISIILGTGNNDNGYGQPLSSPIKYKGDIITANDWLLLRNDIDKVRTHQTGNQLGTSSSMDGKNLVTIAQNSVVNDSHREQYNIVADVSIFEKLNRIPSQYNTVALSSATRTTPWLDVSETIIISGNNSGDGSFNNLRYFFNTGGKIIFSPSRSGGLSNFKNNGWTSFLSSISAVEFTAHSTTKTGITGNSTTIGFYELTTNDAYIFTSLKNGISSTHYLYYDIKARVNEQRTQIIFTISYRDTGEYSKVVTGILSSVVSHTVSKSPVPVYQLSSVQSGILNGTVPVYYSISPSKTYISEGETITFTLFCTQPITQNLQYRIQGAVASKDFTSNSLYGNIISNGSDVITFSLTASADYITEGNEQFNIQILDGATVLCTSPNIIINDTTLYSYYVNTSSVNEGGSVQYTISTSSYGIGDLIYVTLSGNNVSDADFIDGMGSRTHTFYNTQVSGTIYINSNYTHENYSRYFYIQVRNATNTVVGSMGPITINDISPAVTVSMNSFSITQKSHKLTTTGSWTIPNNIFGSTIDAIVYGAGGAGGRYHSGCNYKTGHYGGRGGNGAVKKYTINVSPAQVMSYVIGAGGIPNGGTGGTSYFGSSDYSALGGSGGKNGYGGHYGASATNLSVDGAQGGVGGQHRDKDAKGKAGENGYITLQWKELVANSTLSLSSNCKVSYNISTTQLPDGTVAYVVLSGNIMDTDIAGGRFYTTTIYGNAANGEFYINSLVNTGNKNIKMQIFLNSYSGTMIYESETIPVLTY